MSLATGVIIEASDRKYIVDRNGSLRVLEYTSGKKVSESESDPSLPEPSFYISPSTEGY